MLAWRDGIDVNPVAELFKKYHFITSRRVFRFVLLPDAEGLANSEKGSPGQIGMKTFRIKFTRNYAIAFGAVIKILHSFVDLSSCFDLSS